MKDKIKADPLKPITQIQEEEVNNIMESLVDPDEREQFIRSMPRPENAQRSLYRHRGTIIPPTPAPCREIDFNTR